jgi:ribosome maturation factor RimP
MAGPRSGARASVRPGPKRSPRTVLPSVLPLAERLAQAHGVVLWDASFRREAGRETLIIAVDREGGIDAGTISQLAEELSRELDSADAVPGDRSYILEVSSPGAERRVTGADQFRVCRGRTVRVTLRDGRPPLEGVIGPVGNDTVTIEMSEDQVTVPFDDIAQARLFVEVR